LQAIGHKALTPAADGVAVAAKRAGDVLVGGVARLRRGQDDAAAEGQRLRGGASPEQGFELVAEIVWQFDKRAEGAAWQASWQVRPEGSSACHHGNGRPARLHYWLRISETVI
jgi:hypothetical protein